MEQTVRNSAYSDMPNAVSSDGRVNWQVSSGKTTSFYKYYLERFAWWRGKADGLGLPGKENSRDRFSIAARLIHPTGSRPCRLCGESRFVGYMYINDLLAKKWNKLVGNNAFCKGIEIHRAARLLLEYLGFERFKNTMLETFPDRIDPSILAPMITDDDLQKIFLKASHLNSRFLSPGFMANPPDRLDGFHDYGLCCRKEKDPGRSDDNLRSYLHDRRAFRWWTEGDWKLADALYNLAGPGTCTNCHKAINKVSPDHLGPLACGFKQIPFFVPLCQSCNSSRNRRLRSADVAMLKRYEDSNGESTASWQIRKLWDLTKDKIANDVRAKLLSNLLRGVQDYYLRLLYRFWQEGNAHFISYLLSPQFAHYEIKFEGLDPGTLLFTSYSKQYIVTTGSLSLAARSVRIAFEELEMYCLKLFNDRKIAGTSAFSHEKQVEDLLRKAKDLACSPWTEKWNEAVNTLRERDDREELIAQLLEDKEYEKQKTRFDKLFSELHSHFDTVCSVLEDLLFQDGSLRTNSSSVDNNPLHHD